jgi:hypothetical protein
MTEEDLARFYNQMPYFDLSSGQPTRDVKNAIWETVYQAFEARIMARIKAEAAINIFPGEG